MKDYPTNKGTLNSTINYYTLVRQDANTPVRRIISQQPKVGISNKPQGPKTNTLKLVLRPNRGRGNR